MSESQLSEKVIPVIVHAGKLSTVGFMDLPSVRTRSYQIKMFNTDTESMCFCFPEENCSLTIKVKHNSVLLIQS